MSGERRKLLGFDQRVRLERPMRQRDMLPPARAMTTCAKLSWILEGVVGGRRYASARSKTVTVLCRVWEAWFPELTPFGAERSSVLPRVDAPERVALHWAMSVAAYPFFSDIATIVGRLLELQDEAAMAHIVRLVRSSCGAIEKVRGAAQKIVRSMTDWGCLVEPAKGVFQRDVHRD